jgi:hypothetical protein
MVRTKIIILALLILPAFCYSVSQVDEYTIKAALIEKFGRFIEWPTNSISDTFVVSVLGKNPFGRNMDKMAAKFKIKNKPVKVNYISAIKEIDGCQILFICKTEKDRIGDIISYVKNKPVLTVGDTDGFGIEGVHFNFYFNKEGYTHFEINPTILKEADLKVDIHLLEFGKMIERH